MREKRRVCLCVCVCVSLYLCLHTSSLLLLPPSLPLPPSPPSPPSLSSLPLSPLPYSPLSPLFLVHFFFLISYLILLSSLLKHTHMHTPSSHLRLWAHRMILLSINIDEKSWMIFRQLSVENSMEKSTCTNKRHLINHSTENWGIGKGSIG